MACRDPVDGSQWGIAEQDDYFAVPFPPKGWKGLGCPVPQADMLVHRTSDGERIRLIPARYADAFEEWDPYKVYGKPLPKAGRCTYSLVAALTCPGSEVPYDELRSVNA
jgi:hypothetical protein